MIFFNGKLITMENDPASAEAIAIRDGVIQSVGTDAEVLKLQGTSTVMIDLQGHTLMPAFIDGHTHILTFYDRMQRTLDEAQDAALSYGITMVSEMWANEDSLNNLLAAEQSGSLRMRVNVFPSYNDGILDADRQRIMMSTWYPENSPILDPQRLVRIPGIKIFIDGDNFTNERGCWALSDPFMKTASVITQGVCGTNEGDLYWTQEELNKAVKDAQEAGYRVAFHAMGDLALETALNAIENALDGQSNLVYRHQIQHNSLIRPTLLPRYRNLNIAVSVRGYAEMCGLSILDKTFGEFRQSWYVNRYELPSLGIPAYIETDFGWNTDPEDRFSQRSLDPIMHIYGLVTHQFIYPESNICAPDPIAAEKVISINRALEMVTIEPAWAVSMEDHLGSLKPGKYADLVILSGDPLNVDLNDLKYLSVLMTMVGGKVEYCAAGQAAFCPGVELPAGGGNLALNQAVSASASLAANPPQMAVDGNTDSNWLTGDFAPQWIEIDLGAPAQITQIRMRVSQSPKGSTTHEIRVGSVPGLLETIHTLNQITSDGEWLMFTPPAPLENVRYIHIETKESPSWVAWFEIEVIGTR